MAKRASWEPVEPQPEPVVVPEYRVARIKPPTEYDARDAAWTIVKNAKDLNATGHSHAVAWARAYLDFDD